MNGLYLFYNIGMQAIIWAVLLGLLFAIIVGPAYLLRLMTVRQASEKIMAAMLATLVGVLPGIILFGLFSIGGDGGGWFENVPNLIGGGSGIVFHLLWCLSFIIHSVARFENEALPYILGAILALIAGCVVFTFMVAPILMVHYA